MQIGVGINLMKMGVLGGDAGVALGVGGLLSSATAYLAGNEPYHWFDFTTNKALYAGADVGAISNATGYSFSRASTAYYTNSDGTLTSFASGELRQGDRGVLIEGARTNLLLRSQEFDNAAWVKSGATITANAAVAPDGTTTADLVEFTSSGSVRQEGAITTSTASLWVKRASTGSATAIRLATNNTAAWATGYGVKVTLTEEWQRISATGTLTSGATTRLSIGALTDTTGGLDADCAGNVLIWGAQLEAGSFPSSYIPTTTASATRAADVLTCTAGVSYPLSLWAEFERAVGTGGNESIVYVDAGSTADRSLIRVSSVNQASSVTTSASATQSNVSVSNTLAIGTTYKAALSVSTNSVQLCQNGTLGTEDTTATNPAMPTTLRVGAGPSGAEPAFGYIRRAAIFSSALSDADLQSVTT